MNPMWRGWHIGTAGKDSGNGMGRGYHQESD